MLRKCNIPASRVFIYLDSLLQDIMRSFTRCQAADMEWLTWFSLMFTFLPLTGKMSVLCIFYTIIYIIPLEYVLSGNWMLHFRNHSFCSTIAGETLWLKETKFVKYLYNSRELGKSRDLLITAGKGDLAESRAQCCSPLCHQFTLFRQRLAVWVVFFQRNCSYSYKTTWQSSQVYPGKSVFTHQVTSC